MKDEKYNGWTNYETWLVKLWMDNDQGSYNYWQEIAQEIYNEARADANFTKEERAKLDLADQLKNEHEENAPTGTSGVYSDLMKGALGRVDWHEIAQALIDDGVDKETTDDDEA